MLSHESDGLSRSLAALSSFFVGGATLHETLTEVSSLACQTITPADMVGITMVVEGKPGTAIFTDEAAVEIDAAQYRTGEGPCMDAFRHQQVVSLPSVAEDQRWPEFSRSAGEHGIGSVLSIPLVVNHEGVGAMNLYARAAAAFSEEDERLGTTFASQAAIALANAQAYWDAHELSLQLSEAMQSRSTIEQAKGIIMATKPCTPDEAFQVLVRASQRENRKLRDIAEALVTNAQSRMKGP